MSAEQDRICAIALPLLRAARNGGPEHAAVFAPRLEDYARVFTGSLVDQAAAHYQALWSKRIEVTAGAENTELRMFHSLAEGLIHAPEFPGGYRSLTDVVHGRTWIAWSYVRPGDTFGMAYDGLVWLDDRFAWFPKPWRILRIAPHPFYEE